MNKHIQELAEKAGLFFNPLKQEDYAKFAELIVRECAIIANRAENTETEMRCMYDVITEHFGVAE